MQTGMKSKYSDLLLVRETDKTLFGRPDIFFAFLLQCESSEIKKDKQELFDQNWVNLAEIPKFIRACALVPTSLSVLELLHSMHLKGHKFYQDKIKQQMLKTINVKKVLHDYNIYIPDLKMLQNVKRQQSSQEICRAPQPDQ